MGIAESSATISDNDQFLRGIKFDKSQGRYEVNPPWRDLNTNQSTNFDLCVKRLNCLKKFQLIQLTETNSRFCGSKTLRTRCQRLCSIVSVHSNLD